jgi:hypothetical protein
VFIMVVHGEECNDEANNAIERARSQNILTTMLSHAYF